LERGVNVCAQRFGKDQSYLHWPVPSGEHHHPSDSLSIVYRPGYGASKGKPLYLRKIRTADDETP
jgi:hypothetical protein